MRRRIGRGRLRPNRLARERAPHPAAAPALPGGRGARGNRLTRFERHPGFEPGSSDPQAPARGVCGASGPVKALKIGRVGSRERFRFTLEGVIDVNGARSLDRLLFECQARGARAVHLDFAGVTSISTLGSAVLARQGRVYEETERKIHATGLGPEVRAALGEVEAIVY